MCFRGVAAGMSHHFLVEAKVVVAKEWENTVVGCRNRNMLIGPEAQHWDQ